MGAFEDALDRINGPRIEDFFPSSETQASFRPTPAPASGYESLDPPSFDVSRPRSLLDSTPGPSSSPPPPRFLGYDRPLSQRELRGLQPGETPAIYDRDEDYLKARMQERQREKLLEAPKRVADTVGPYAPTALRIAGSFGGLPGLAAAEVGAQALEDYQGAASPDLGRGAINVAFGRIPSVFRPAKPLGRLLSVPAEAAAQNVGYDITLREYEDGRLPTLREAGSAALTGAAFGTPFAAVEAAGAFRHLRELQARRAEMPAKMFQEHTANGGSTFSVDGDNLIGQPAYSVSIYPERSRVIEGDLSPEVVDGYLQSNADLFRRDPRNSVGTWFDKDSGKHYLDVVAVVPDRDAAIDLGKKYNQKAIFDLKNLEEIATGGTGEVIPGLPPEAQRLPKFEHGLFADIRQQGAKARDFLANAYERSGLADERGAINLDIFAPSGVRSKKLKTLNPSAQNVRANLARVAADEIMSPGGTTFEEWTAKMIDRYSESVTPHLKNAWKTAQTTLDRRMRGSVSQLPNTKRATQLLKAGRSGEDWYEPMQRELHQVFGDDTDLVLQFIAATSPQANIEHNLQSALKAYVQYKAGARDVHPDAFVEASTMRANLGRARKGEELLPIPEPTQPDAPGFRSVLFPEWLTAATRGEEFGGPKVRNFLKAMRGDSDAVVIDLWMQRYLGYRADAAGKMPQMTDFEYSLNADYIRAQAEKSGMTPSSFQERIWRGIKRTWPEARSHDTDEPYQVVIKERHKNGLSLFDESTLRTFNRHETLIAKQIDVEMLSRGRVNETAPGLKAPEGGVFDWSSGETTGAPIAARRANQSGAVKLDVLLPLWAVTKVAQGVNTFRKFAASAIERFGLAIKPWLSRAWGVGRRRALSLAQRQVEPPEDPKVKGRLPLGSAPASARPEPAGEMPNDRIQNRNSFRMAFGKQRGQALLDLMERHRGLVETQTRGVQGDVRRQELAEQVVWDLDALARGKKPAPGKVLNNEERKSLSDLIVSLDAEHDKLGAERDAKLPAGAWSDADEAKLIETQQSLITANAIAFGSDSEAGRALRTSRAIAHARDLGDFSFIKAARARGLDPNDIARIRVTHKTPLERMRAMQALQKMSVADWWRWGLYTGKLLDQTTWTKVLIGNGLSTAARLASTPGIVASDKLFHRGNRYVYGRELNPSTVGLSTGLWKGLQRGFDILHYGTTPEDLVNGIIPHEVPVKNEVLRGVVNGTGRILSAADAVSRGILDQIEMEGLSFARAKRDAIERGLSGKSADDHIEKQMTTWRNNPPAWMVEHVSRLSTRYTLQAPLGQVFGRIEAGLNRAPIAKAWMSPFLRAGVNFLKLSKTYAGGGFREATHLRRAAASPEGAKKYAERAYMPQAAALRAQESGSFAREASIRQGEAATGVLTTLVLLPALWHVGAIDITGDPPPDRGEADRLREQRPPNSIKIGPVWVDYSGMPFAPMLRSLANTHDTWERIGKTDPDGATRYLERAAFSLLSGAQGLMKDGGPLVDMSALTDMLHNPDSRTLARGVGQLASQGVPFLATANKVNRYLDPVQRQQTEFLDPFRAVIPPQAAGVSPIGTSADLAPRLNAVGEPIRKRGYPLTGIALRPVFPGPVDATRAAAAEAGVEVSPPTDKTLKLPGEAEERKLSLASQRAIQLAKAKVTRLALDQAVLDPSWSTMDQPTRERSLRKRINGYRESITKIAVGLAMSGRPITYDSIASTLAGGQ